MPAWRRNVYILLAVQVLSTAGFSLVFPFLPLYVREIGVATRGSIEFWVGMVFSSQAIVMAFSSPLWGAFADRHGRKLMLVRATLGGAVLVVLMGFVQNVEQLVILRIIQGSITGVVSSASALVAATAPRDKSGEALGMMALGRWGGVAIGPIVGGILGDAFGFRESFWITGAMLGTAGICTLLWVHEEFKPRKETRKAGIFGGFKELLAAPGMSGLYELNFLRALGQTMIYPIASLFVVELSGTDEGAALMTGYILGAAALTSAISSMWLGRLGDRIGHTRILVISALTATALYIPQYFVTAAWQLVVLQGLAGFAMGGMVPSIAALMNLWGPTGNQGATYGLDNSVNAAARSIAPMIGAAIGVWIGYRGVFAFNALVFLAVALLSIHVVRAGQAAIARQAEMRERQAAFKGAGD